MCVLLILITSIIIITTIITIIIIIIIINTIIITERPVLRHGVHVHVRDLVVDIVLMINNNID